MRRQPTSATAELTLAFILALRGRPDRTPPLVRSALTKVDAMNPRLLARQLALAAYCMWLREDPAHDFVDAEVRSLAKGDPIIEAWADLLAAKSGLAPEGPILTEARAAELIERSERIGNIHAAWLASRLAARSALMAEDPDTGLRHLRHAAALHRRLGGKLTADLVEFEADFAAMAGGPRRSGSAIRSVEHPGVPRGHQLADQPVQRNRARPGPPRTFGR